MPISLIILPRSRRASRLAEGRELLLCLDIARPDQPRPLFGFVDDELGEVRGRADKYHATEVDKPRLKTGISKAGIDLRVEPVNDLGWRLPGCPETIQQAGLVAGYEIAHRWNVR